MTVFDRNIAVIGCGYWGDNLVPNFYEIGGLITVCNDDAGDAMKQAL